MFEAFSLPFMQLALGSSLLAALIGSTLGVYVVLRRVVFVGAALSQISAAGVALAFILGLAPNAIALLVTLVAVAFFAFLGEERRITQESMLGLAYAVASAATILLIGQTGHGPDDILNLLFGNILAIAPADLGLIAFACLLVAGVLFTCRRPFLLSFFDPEMARSLGYRPRFWNLLFYLTLGVAVASLTKVTGALLTFTFLVVPAMTALVLTKGFRTIFGISIASAILAAVAGLLLSFHHDLPTAPTIVVVSIGIFVIASGVGRLKQLRS